MKGRWVFKVLLFAIVAGGVLAFAVMNLWNWLIPSIIGWRAITFGQALGLLILSRILFGSFPRPRRFGGPWRRRMMERWAKMTPEEREKFRQGF